MERPLVLLADSDLKLVHELEQILELENFHVQLCPNGLVLLETDTRNHASLIVIDKDLPRNNGFAALKELRKTTQVPVIFTAENPMDSHHITALELGADAFVFKPYSMKAMVLQVQALLHRTRRPRITTFRWKDVHVSLDVPGHKIYIDKKDAQLTGSEWEIFILLFGNTGRIFSRDQLAQQCLGYNPDGDTRTIDTHVANLRAKIPLDGLIETVRGYGYRISPSDIFPEITESAYPK